MNKLVKCEKCDKPRDNPYQYFQGMCKECYNGGLE